jgi:FkbM family methyltransferase
MAWGARLVPLAGTHGAGDDLAPGGVYDPALVRFLEHSLRRGGVAVDVGAGIGAATVRMAQLVGPTGQVLALEPDPGAFAVLEDNLVRSGVSGWARAMPVAAFSETTTLVLDPIAASPAVAEGIPLDELLADMGVVDVVTVEAGGRELHVLEGMAGVVAHRRVRTLALRPVPAALGEDRAPLRRLLQGYTERDGATIGTVTASGSVAPATVHDALSAHARARVIVRFGRTAR